jgi:hypothetical protein
MHKALVLFVLIFAVIVVQAQCTTTNGTGCLCADGTTNCDLLPDITVADEPLLITGTNGVIEYSQTGNGAQNGKLRLSVSTPNIGHGPLTVRSSSQYICGNDTFGTDPGTCPDGSSPRILCYQRVYHKNGTGMSYYDRPAGSMTYHPTHNHMHVDDWGIYTLRTRDTTNPDPLQWPVIGTGAKLGFCLMDYGNCSFYSGHCQDTAGNTLLNSNIPNYGLGGGAYACSPVEQGISAGYVDIYFQYLDDMYLNIPPGVCNGQYYLVVQIDPHNYFTEENENNNVIAVPYTLTKQVAWGAGSVPVQTSLPNTTICSGNSITLTASQSSNYLWNTGDTTQSIVVTQAGTYSVSTNSVCGAGTSNPVTINTLNSQVLTAVGDTGCQGVAALTATTTGTAYWYSTDTGLTSLHAGNTFTPNTVIVDTYYVQSHDTAFGISGSVGEPDSISDGSFYLNDQYTIFTVYKPILLKSVKVYARTGKNRTIQLRNQNGAVLQSKTVYVPDGESQIDLGFYIQPGVDYQLGWPVASSPDLYRNSSGAHYPYDFSDLISITRNSSGDGARWYCYYNWMVEQAPVACTSTRVPVAATITPAPVVTLSGIDTVYHVFDTPVTLTGTPANGQFNGPGVQNNTFNPSAAGIGGPYAVSYQYTDTTTGCTGTATVQVTVLDSNTAIANVSNGTEYLVFPNPGKGSIYLKTKNTPAETFAITVADMQGRIVYSQGNVLLSPQSATALNLQHLSSGVYYLQLANKLQHSTIKIVIEQ